MNIRLLVLTLLIAGMLHGQDRLHPTSSFVVNFDLARFKNNDSTQYVEMYIACFPHLVTMEKDPEGYTGLIELRLQMTDKVTGENAVDTRSLIPVRVKDTTEASYRTTIVAQMAYVVPEGSYRMSVVAIDSLASGRQDSMTFPIDIVPTAETISMSDIELCSNIRQSTNRTDPFYKNAHEVVPNPTLLFGPVNHPVIFHYLELYNLEKDETYTIRTVLADGGGRTVQESSRQRRFGVDNAIDVGTTNATKLPSGKYRFAVHVMGKDAQTLARNEKLFYVYNPYEEVLSVASMVETELTGLTSEELSSEFETARYLATMQEIDTFSKIATLEGKREFLAQFWAEALRGKLGFDPISRRDYLERVKRANERYRVLTRAGYRTDRGRVLVLYAEPDEIERRPSHESGKPYEIWSYYRIENGVQFVFVDRTGFGDYQLVHSTKRGELRDDSWERLLQ